MGLAALREESGTPLCLGHARTHLSEASLPAPRWPTPAPRRRREHGCRSSRSGVFCYAARADRACKHRGCRDAEPAPSAKPSDPTDACAHGGVSPGRSSPRKVWQGKRGNGLNVSVRAWVEQPRHVPSAAHKARASRGDRGHTRPPVSASRLQGAAGGAHSRRGSRAQNHPRGRVKSPKLCCWWVSASRATGDITPWEGPPRTAGPGR